jgi:hypothetical protein
MLAAEKCAFLFEPVTDDVNTAIRAARSERMDSALKAIEGVGPSGSCSLETLCRSHFRTFRTLP